QDLAPHDQTADELRQAVQRPRPASPPVRHVLAVDDDQATRAMIADCLTNRNIRVTTAADGREMAGVLSAGGVDLVILDLQLGSEDGLELMRSLRAESDLPVIVLTGHRRDAVDRVVGLELGADDYLTKPFSPRELLARVRAVLRPSVSSTRPPSAKEAGKEAAKEAQRMRYRFAGWELSLRTRQLTASTGARVPLTKGEFALLTAFVQAPQRVLTREQLLAASRV